MHYFLLCLTQSHVVLFIMAPNLKKKKKNPLLVLPVRGSIIDLETKIKVIKDYEDRKSMIVIAHWLGISHSIIAVILKNKNKVTKAVKGAALLKVMRLTKILEGPISDMK